MDVLLHEFYKLQFLVEVLDFLLNWAKLVFARVVSELYWQKQVGANELSQELEAVPDPFEAWTPLDLGDRLLDEKFELAQVVDSMEPHIQKFG